MTGDNDIGKSEQTGEGIVADDVIAEIVEVQFRLFLIDVEADGPEMTAFQGGNEGAGVDEGAAASVDEQRPLGHAREAFRIDEVIGVWSEGEVEAHDAGLAKEGVEIHILHAQGLADGVGIRIVTEESAPHAVEDPGQGGADLAGSDQAYGLAVHVETEQSIEEEVALANAVVSLVQVAVEGEHETEGEFGDGIGRVIAHAHDREP